LLENSKLTGLLYCGDTKGKPHLAQGPNSTVIRVEFFCLGQKLRVPV
jgi:hypothetical protein